MEKSPSIENQVIAEIGPGILPVYRLFEDETFEKIGKGSTYIAIDYNQEEIERLQHIRDKRGHVLVSDIRELALKTASIDQMWLMNVLSSMVRKPFDGDVDGIFQELARVVKQKGKIYIGEIYDPSSVAWLKEYDYSIFGLDKTVYTGFEEVRLFWERMSGRKAIIDHIENKNKMEGYAPFFIELEKGER